MAEYIDLDTPLELYVDRGGFYRQQITSLRELLNTNKIPYTAADVRPVVCGRWKPRDLTCGRSYYYCTACEETVDMPTAMGIPMFNFCPNCGADMRCERRGTSDDQ